MSDPEDRLRKLKQIRDPHVRPLNDLVDRWRSRWPDRPIPWFDPADGGVAATTLLLMEAPGPRTAAMGEQGFCSEDNTDATNAVLRHERERSGLRRRDYVKWNIIPWQVTDAAGKWRSPRPRDLEEAAQPLTELLALLPDLALVITVGRAALHGWTRHQTLFADRVMPVLAVPHPSQRNTVGREEALARLRWALHQAPDRGTLQP
ncbi:uracil-DNA glycosylase [Jatrophihabitans endophyticus]|uniref:uracil-DNA glycosylase n=1 Tax=Jatrophihabitans endophyticus TaxID=1206085 RepID=UPI0019F8790A|nr:uracil-DNA glycosylase [Jatrophihabitans endophyticus]MBE7188623.1 uracil-DNA glycosylase [Jatrophihabitans endophyticus]